jgi:hypothetical protein
VNRLRYTACCVIQGLTAPKDQKVRMLRIEICLSVAAILWTFAFPHFGSRWFERVESSFSRFAQRRELSVAAVRYLGCRGPARRFADPALANGGTARF